MSDLAYIQFSSVPQSCPTLCDPMNRSTPGLPVHHQLPEFLQTHVHRVGDAIQPSHPLSSAFPPAPNPSQHQSLFNESALRMRSSLTNHATNMPLPSLCKTKSDGLLGRTPRITRPSAVSSIHGGLPRAWCTVLPECASPDEQTLVQAREAGPCRPQETDKHHSRGRPAQRRQPPGNQESLPSKGPFCPRPSKPHRFPTALPPAL